MKNLILYITIASLAFSITLQEAYDNAEPVNGYDKYVVLEPNQIYEAGLGIFEGNVVGFVVGSEVGTFEGTVVKL